MAWIALAAAAFFLVQSEKQIQGRRASMRAFDLRARETADALADLRASQEAYVAAGQGLAFWAPKVASTAETVARSIAALRQSVTSDAARFALEAAASTFADFASIDQRVREYLQSDQTLMAADVVFTEGVEAASSSARQVERARIEEQLAFDAWEAVERRREAMAGAGTAALMALVAALLIPLPRRAESPSEVPVDPQTTLLGHASGSQEPTASSPLAPSRDDGPGRNEVMRRRTIPGLKAAAELCTDLGRVREAEDLAALLARAADVLDASGLVLWVGNASGADLRPALAHGYSATAVARMPSVPRSADNAAAAAYRSGTLQIVLARPGSSAGAVVAPLLSTYGCIGALSAEIRGGAETSDHVQALAAIFAAQLASLVATAPEATERRVGGIGL